MRARPHSPETPPKKTETAPAVSVFGNLRVRLHWEGILQAEPPRRTTSISLPAVYTRRMPARNLKSGASSSKTRNTKT